jgi:integrase
MAKRIVALTDDRINKLKPAAKRRAVYDPAVPGLAIRVQPSGHKTFVFGARYPRTRQFSRIELGQAGRLTLGEAREKARAWAKLIERGIDPRDDEVRQREAAAEAAKAVAEAADNSFAAVAEAFIARRLRGQRKAAVVAREIRTELVPHWGIRPITAITRRDVVELIEKIVDRPAPAYAHNIFGHVRTLFNWAINSNKYDFETSPCDRLEPKELIGAKKTRERVLDDDELRALWRVSDALGYPLAPVVKALMLTGSRLNEVAGARWREFDLEGRLWTVPAERFKMNAEHFVPLTDDLIALLGTVPRWRRGDHLFTTTDGEKPVFGFSSKAKARLDKAMRAELNNETPPWTLHDIRRTVRTRLSALRIKELVAELVIGHGRKGMGRIYDQHRYLDEMREALDAWAALLRSIVNPPPVAAGNVVPLAKKRA